MRRLLASSLDLIMDNTSQFRGKIMPYNHHITFFKKTQLLFFKNKAEKQRRKQGMPVMPRGSVDVIDSPNKIRLRKTVSVVIRNIKRLLNRKIIAVIFINVGSFLRHIIDIV